MATPLTEDQKDKYEELFQQWILKYHRIYDNNTIEIIDFKRKKAFLAGTEHAHPIGFNLGKEEGKVEGWNEAIEMAIRRLQYSKAYLLSEQINELQKLRK